MSNNKPYQNNKFLSRKTTSRNLVDGFSNLKRFAAKYASEIRSSN